MPYAYCLMRNYVHLLQQMSDSPLAKFMRELQQSSTQWFNRAHGTVGHLCQGRHTAIVCETEQYLAALIQLHRSQPGVCAAG